MKFENQEKYAISISLAFLITYFYWNIKEDILMDIKITLIAFYTVVISVFIPLMLNEIDKTIESFKTKYIYNIIIKKYNIKNYIISLIILTLISVLSVFTNCIILDLITFNSLLFYFFIIYIMIENIIELKDDKLIRKEIYENIKNDKFENEDDLINLYLSYEKLSLTNNMNNKLEEIFMKNLIFENKLLVDEYFIKSIKIFLNNKIKEYKPYVDYKFYNSIYDRLNSCNGEDKKHFINMILQSIYYFDISNNKEVLSVLFEDIKDEKLRENFNYFLKERDNSEYNKKLIDLLNKQKEEN